MLTLPDSLRGDKQAFGVRSAKPSRQGTHQAFTEGDLGGTFRFSTQRLLFMTYIFILLIFPTTNNTHKYNSIDFKRSKRMGEQHYCFCVHFRNLEDQRG